MEKTYNPHEVEEKWIKYWEENGIYKFDPNSDKPIFSIDTPPRYASGDLHMGHAKNYTEFEVVARYKRMRGYNVFFPNGFDDNGLPTEKMVEKKYGKSKRDFDRKEFIELCKKEAEEVIKRMKETFIRIGFSCDWDYYYHTIDDYCQKQAQRSFIDLYNKGQVYRAEEPVIWCTYHQTALAQAEVEDKKRTTKLNYIYFTLEDGSKIEIATTRPELLPSCVGIFVNPRDERYKHLVGKKARVPLFNFEVPIMEDEAVDMEFGTGIVMICTFGDTQDIEWWKKHNLPMKISIKEDGTLNELAGKYEGLKLEEARKRIIEDLEKEGLLVKQEPLEQTVGVCWRCGTPVEFIPTKQWFIKALDHKEKLLELGDKINWYPEYYKVRYVDWVKNLKWDWIISRQRYFGVPFPVWYCNKCGKIRLAKEEELPVDPRFTTPEEKCECGGEFVGEQDVMDTWMTSSLTPQIATKWKDDPEFFSKMFPMSLRPQAHDIIRTWAFYTILKAYLHNNSIPWKDIMISGYVYVGKGIAMSSSKGIGTNPKEIVDKYGADVLRYWATSATLGEDLIYREQDVIRGKKVLTKLWNIARFINSHISGYEPKSKPELRTVDKWILSKLSKVIKQATEYMEKYEINKEKKVVENFLINVFADYYLEMVKYRLYKEEKDEAALYTLYTVLEAVLKLLAPHIPFITEEIYNTIYKKGSIHKSSWPELDMEDEGVEMVGDKAIEFISEVRKFKSKNHMSMGAPIKSVVIWSKVELGDALEDIKNTVRAEEISFLEGEDKVEVTK